MGPVEIIFIVIVLLFGAVGVVRGYNRELGVTVMLLLALFVLVFVEIQFPTGLQRFLALIAGPGAQQQAVAKALLYTFFLVLMVFISYQGETLSYPGAARSPVLSFFAGLLNGYLFAGSVWYYLAEANWPFLNIQAPFTDAYRAMVRLLPPVVLDWRYLIVLIVILLILRVWK
jgi:hypothetical protein